MDALLLYVNERFQVVEGFTLDYESQIGDMKVSLVARTLWENVEIIDAFVRDNPAHLPQQCLDTALAWKNALPGMYIVVRYQGGRALMMNDVGVFSVSGVTLELEGEIGKVPAYVEMVLLPFDDLVVYDGFMQVYDVGGTASDMSTAAEFIDVAGMHLATKRDEELDALLAELSREAAGDEETLPPGFHRGVLAGLDTLERESAVAAELAQSLAGYRHALCANLPYSITSPVLTKIYESGCFEFAVVMVQKEVADRICATPGQKDYGAFTLLTRWYAEPELLFTVGPECFMPRPKVTSAVVRLTMRPEPPYKTDEKLLFRLIRAAFNMRRKTLVNALDSVCGKDKAGIALAACGFPDTVRGETLSLEDFVNLTNTLDIIEEERL